ncbi:tail fiber assembly protein [Enterobacter kobei]|uniref:tail fiber assembly protein n=1 Tax=Enterobacter cloacae complex TaxID=354276 RepID=UPI001BDEBEB6|nr:MULTISPECIES: tail fiber assembly protein [Enterobacter cloacae complex]MBT1867890.1 tail fiber assembly protein [Enterobacter asburiae]MBT1895005.1 tail fiber assembly protein [Enterobacter asburiae]MCK7194502.1 tail fiber assembly protein [Enterobacter kobei]
MTDFAVIKAGIVTNIIVWDGKGGDFSKDIDGALIEVAEGDSAGIGWSYDGNIFAPPPEPEKTKAQMVAEAEMDKEGRINSANDYMNSKQWPGKAAIGRLKGDELAQYNLWLDYLDELEKVDTSEPQQIIWPENPES